MCKRQVHCQKLVGIQSCQLHGDGKHMEVLTAVVDIEDLVKGCHGH